MPQIGTNFLIGTLWKNIFSFNLGALPLRDKSKILYTKDFLEILETIIM